MWNLICSRSVCASVFYLCAACVIRFVLCLVCSRFSCNYFTFTFCVAHCRPLFLCIFLAFFIPLAAAKADSAVWKKCFQLSFATVLTTTTEEFQMHINCWPPSLSQCRLCAIDSLSASIQLAPVMSVWVSVSNPTRRIMSCSRFSFGSKFPSVCRQRQHVATN